MDTEQKLRKNCQKVREILQIPVVDGDRDGIIGKLNDLVQISGLTSNNVAASKALYRQAQLTVIEGLWDVKTPLPASTLNEYIKAKTGNLESLYELCDRQDKRVSYAIDAMRTMISLYKEELSNSEKEI